MALAIFDLDGTLLTGDSDVLWCAFLQDQGRLDSTLVEACRAAASKYRDGTVSPQAYCTLQAQLLAGRPADELQDLQQRFFDGVIRPRIPPAARELLQRHRRAGDLLVLTTATNSVVSGLTAQDLGVDGYLCTELEWDADGRCAGRTRGTLNIRMGKVARLRTWLAERQLPESLLRRASFYTDSINDLALLSVVGHPTVVDPDPRLAATAMRKGWAQVHLHPVDGPAADGTDLRSLRRPRQRAEA
jgi:HAD superfamily hydrolase (TIGR01490 family)